MPRSVSSPYSAVQENRLRVQGSIVEQEDDFWHIGLRIGSDETRKALLLIPSQLLNQPTRDFNPRLNTVSETGGRNLVFEADVCLIQSFLSLRRAVSFIPSFQLLCHDGVETGHPRKNKRFDCPRLHCATRSDADCPVRPKCVCPCLVWQ